MERDLLFSLFLSLHDGAADLAETVATGTTRVEGLGAAVTSWLRHLITVHEVVVCSNAQTIVGRELSSSTVDIQV